MTTTTAYPPLPAGFEPIGTGYFEPHHIPVAASKARPRQIVAWFGRWMPVAPIVKATDKAFTVACPTCPPPRLRKRKAPRALHELTTNHLHGRSSEGVVQHRTPHHVGPDYVALDVYGIFAATPTAGGQR